MIIYLIYNPLYMELNEKFTLWKHPLLGEGELSYNKVGGGDWSRLACWLQNATILRCEIYFKVHS